MRGGQNARCVRHLYPCRSRGHRGDQLAGHRASLGAPRPDLDQHDLGSRIAAEDVRVRRAQGKNGAAVRDVMSLASYGGTYSTSGNSLLFHYTFQSPYTNHCLPNTNGVFACPADFSLPISFPNSNLLNLNGVTYNRQ